MDNENQELDFSDNNAKLVFSVRISANLKQELFEEAQAARWNTSEYGEMILENRHRNSEENSKLKQKNDLLEKENNELKNENLGLKRIVGHSSRERLKFLFEKVKGKKDTVDNAYGDKFEIVYDSTNKLVIINDLFIKTEKKCYLNPYPSHMLFTL
jgi:hypothetical protein